MAFKLKNWNAFDKNMDDSSRFDGRAKSSAFQKTTDPPVDKNWKENQSIMDDLQSLKNDLKDAKSEEEKRKIQMDIKQTQEIIDKDYDKSSQLHPKSTDVD